MFYNYIYGRKGKASLKGDHAAKLESASLITQKLFEQLYSNFRSLIDRRYQRQLDQS